PAEGLVGAARDRHRLIGDPCPLLDVEDARMCERESRRGGLVPETVGQALVARPADLLLARSERIRRGLRTFLAEPESWRHFGEERTVVARPDVARGERDSGDRLRDQV